MGDVLSKAPQPMEETPTPPKQEPLLAEPWRTHKILSDGWTEKVHKALLDDIANKLKENINVVFIGPVASGKSSLINSYFTTVLNRITSKAPAGRGLTSHTLHLHQIRAVNQLKNITFYDTMGLEEAAGKGLQTERAQQIAKGEIEPGTKLDKDIVDTVEKKELFQHCIVYVLDGENIKLGLKEDLRKKIAEIKERIKDMPSGPNRVVIVTHTDNVCTEVKDDITKVFNSAAVYEVIKKVHNVTGVTFGNIFPVKNYVTEQDSVEQVDILLLLALQRIVDFSIDAIDRSNNDNYSTKGSNSVD
ncbi:uncharacterized protein LOC132751161 [Ruditapes philippinarum]|uniref:uncharacterized protein LOC132751161 n=1 Tax=Ruditapes philippinarum TaxID=129788 RepID=UPI00295C180E|nr:uncharacterized protein LOC132751161 [Ruditapes philippinarum]